jgi:uncharacterized protein YjbJ (UPF0337 family)
MDSHSPGSGNYRAYLQPAVWKKGALTSALLPCRNCTFRSEHGRIPSNWEHLMNQDTVSGKFDQVAGKIKQGVGEAIGNDRLANKGAADQVKGHAKEAWGNVKDTAADLRDSSASSADARAEEAHRHAEDRGEDVRDSITSAARHAKDNINRGLDHLKGDSNT